MAKKVTKAASVRYPDSRTEPIMRMTGFDRDSVWCVGADGKLRLSKGSRKAAKKAAAKKVAKKR